MQNGLVLHHVWWLKIGRDILAAEVTPEEQGVPAPHQVPQARVPMMGREVPINSCCENQWGLRLSETEGFWSPSF